MLGAIAGDIVGSVYEGNPIKTTDFPLFSSSSTFTDDTVLSCAVAECLLGRGSYAKKLKEYYARYPWAGYGGSFIMWASSDSSHPYYSWGNGSAMRASPVGFAAADVDSALEEARRSAEVTHNHPEGIIGAQAVAVAVFLARSGESKMSIRESIEDRFGYDLSRNLDDIRPRYRFDVSCQGSVPEAIIAFLESDDFEDAVRGAVSLGGDTDTQACIAGGIAEAFYGGVPEHIAGRTLDTLDERLRSVVEEFRTRFRLS